MNIMILDDGMRVVKLVMTSYGWLQDVVDNFATNDDYFLNLLFHSDLNSNFEI
jgi:hypothetical protein